jgi:hypothetical protein
VGRWAPVWAATSVIGTGAATGPDALATDDRSRTSSTRLFQAPQAGQRPTQRGAAAPHSVQA